jgi:hypothetical protein
MIDFISPGTAFRKKTSSKSPLPEYEHACRRTICILRGQTLEVYIVSNLGLSRSIPASKNPNLKTAGCPFLNEGTPYGKFLKEGPPRNSNMNRISPTENETYVKRKRQSH